ncbi:MAG: TAXI family TRAP transporter solute-binding subunit [Firmicutes bacterium]|nr:TAXI family TRAP transporter solute-binding subunit [Bacillota bacterium]
MNRRAAVWICAFLVAVFLIAGCGAPAAEKKPEPKPGETKPAESKTPGKEAKLLFATGGTSGSYYPLGGAMAQVWNKKIEGLSVTVQATGASVENVRLLGNKNAELALCMSDIAYYGQNSLEIFADKQEKYTNYSAVGAIYPETVQIFVRKDSPVKSIPGLKGKRVSVGPPGSGTEVSARQILGIYGLDYKQRKDVEPRYISFAETADQFKDKLIDAGYAVLGVPNAAIQDITAVVPIRLLDIDDDMLAKIHAKYPYYSRLVIPGGSYKGQDDPTKTITLKAILLARNDLDESLVYNLTRTLYENAAEVAGAHALGKHIKLETAMEGIAIPFHPGAMKYFKEKGIAR